MTDVHDVREMPAGRALTPADEEYDAQRRPWNLAVDQHPAVVVMAESGDDVRAAIRLARERGLPLAVQSSGHGVVHPCDDGVVVNVSRMTSAHVDPASGVATVGAGTQWRTILEAADPYGLAGLSGTAPTVGAVGYTLGGGLGLLLRSHGFAADSIVGADVVTAHGESIRADDTQHRDLLWALKGGSGNFGVVTSLDLRLHSVAEVYNGMVVYPGDSAGEVLGAWAAWTRQVSDDVTSAAMVMTLPPVPAIPEPIRGKQVVAVRATIVGGDAAPVDELIAGLGEPLVNTFTASSYLQAALSGSEPTEPMPTTGSSALLSGVSDQTITRLVAAVGPDSPANPLEVRHLGGRARVVPDPPSAVSNRDAEYVVAMHAALPDAKARRTAEHYMDSVLADLGDRRAGHHINFMRAGSSADEVREAFSADAYTRLQEVKQAYDPENMFRYNHNIPPGPG